MYCIIFGFARSLDLDTNASGQQKVHCSGFKKSFSWGTEQLMSAAMWNLLAPIRDDDVVCKEEEIIVWKPELVFGISVERLYYRFASFCHWVEPVVDLIICKLGELCQGLFLLVRRVRMSLMYV